MQFFIDNWFLILIALVSGSMLLAPMLQGGGAAAVTPAQAVQLVNREKAVLIDVCEPAEHAAGHPVGARNAPLGALEGHKALPANKATPVVLVCQSGARANRAVGILRKAGYQNVHSLGGGLAAWREANLPIERSKA